MSEKEPAFWKRTTLANLAAFMVVLFGLGMSYATGNKELMGAIIGASLTWIYRVKNE